MIFLLRLISLLFLLISFSVSSAEKNINKDCSGGYASHKVRYLLVGESCNEAAVKSLKHNDDYYCEKNGSNIVLLKLLACNSVIYSDFMKVDK